MYEGRTTPIPVEEVHKYDDRSEFLNDIESNRLRCKFTQVENLHIKTARKYKKIATETIGNYTEKHDRPSLDYQQSTS